MRQIILLMVLAALAPTTNAAPISFTFTGNGSGTLDGQAFVDANFEINAQADTNNWVDITQEGSRYPTFSITPDSASINLEGFGSFDFITETWVWTGQGSLGFGRGEPYQNNLYTVIDWSVVYGWDRTSSIAPTYTTDTSLIQWGENWDAIVTSGGIVTIDRASRVPGAFEVSVSSVPIPAAAWLFGSAIGLLGWLRRTQI